MFKQRKIINWDHFHVRQGITWKLLATRMNLSFMNQENEEITKIDWRIDKYKI